MSKKKTAESSRYMWGRGLWSQIGCINGYFKPSYKGKTESPCQRVTMEPHAVLMNSSRNPSSVCSPGNRTTRVLHILESPLPPSYGPSPSVGLCVCLCMFICVCMYVCECEVQNATLGVLLSCSPSSPVVSEAGSLTELGAH